MNSKHYKRKSKIQHFENNKAFKSVFGPLIRLENVDEELELEPSTRWGKIKKWFSELPIWSRKID